MSYAGYLSMLHTVVGVGCWHLGLRMIISKFIVGVIFGFGTSMNRKATWEDIHSILAINLMVITFFIAIAIATWASASATSAFSIT